jgi:thiamine kinase-like enzyme
MTNQGLKAAIAQVPGWDPARLKITPLRGGLTNSNFKVEANGAAFVLKLDGQGTRTLGIDRGRERACLSIAASLGIGPEVYCFLPRQRSLVTRFIAGKPVSAAAKPSMLERIAASIKRIHYGPPFSGVFSPFSTVLDYHAACRGRGLAAVRPFHAAAVASMEHIKKALGGRALRRPCHNDLLASNLIDDGETIRIVDWEYAAMGDPFFDLGNFAVNQRLTQDNRRFLLMRYFGEVRTKDLARLNLYGLASDLREAYWGFLQCGLSDLRFDFRAYGLKHLGRFLRGARGARFEAWLREASAR